MHPDKMAFSLVVCCVLLLVVSSSGCPTKEQKLEAPSIHPGLGCSWSSVTRPSLDPFKFSDTTPVTLLEETYTETCECFYTYAKEIGISIGNWDTKPEAGGYVNFTLNADITPINQNEHITYQTQEETWVCPCTGTKYPDFGSCNAICGREPGGPNPLACAFPTTCALLQQKQVCVKGHTDYNLEPHVHPEAFVKYLEWKPNGQVSQECNDSIANFHRHILEHEQQHIIQMEKAIANQTKEIKDENQSTGELYACGKDETEALQVYNKKVSDNIKQNINQKLGQKLEVLLENIKRDYHQRSDEFHRSLKGDDILLLNCSKCSYK